MPVYPSGGTIAQSVGSPGFGPAPAPSYTSPGSVRLNPADTAYFSYTPTLQGSRTTWTWAGWVKRSALGNTYQELFGTPNGASDSTFLVLTFGSNGIADTLGFQIWNSTYRTTTQLFRDPSQWYHIVCAVDTTQATAADRVKLYANGTQITAFSTSNNPAQFAQLSVNVAGSIHAIGRDLQQSINFGGYMAEVYFVDGQALTPASFTETSSTTGQLIPISTGYTGVYGTNGFYLPFSSNALAVDLGQNKKVTGQDGYWPYNTLLVNTTNTNGQQNNTFLDSSTNNFTITRNGNTTQGRFGPFAPGGGTTQANGYFSGYFDGTGDYLSLPASGNASYINGTGNFTIDFWVYYNALPTGSAVANTGCSWYAQDSGLAIVSPFNLIQAGNTWYLYADTGAGTWNIFSQVTIATTTLSAGQWYHVACVRDSTNIRLYINGVQVGTASIGAASIWQNTVRNLYLFGAWQNTAGSTGLNGYVSNYRLVKGTCLYPGGTTFTVPTTPLTNITNTSLLTCQSSQFIDNSTNAFAITVNGNTRPTVVNPFGMTDWSGYFDGTGDYLTAPSVTGTTLDGNFTIEYFMYRPASGNNWIFTLGDAFLSSGIETYIGTSGTLFNLWVSGANRVSSSVLPPVGIWSHVAVVRSGTTITLYLNGVSLGTYTSSTTFSGITYVGAERYNGSITGVFTGFLSNFRIVKGTALYTSTFTPPTAPLTAISGTQLLTCQSSTFVDNSPNALTITTNGNPYTLTLNNPFNSPVNYTTPPTQSWSNYFDGTGDYLTAPNNAAFDLGSGNATIEAWVFPASSGQTCGIFDKRSVGANYSQFPQVALVSGAFVAYVSYTGSSWAGIINGATPAVNTWTHVAFVRNGNTWTLYVNGVVSGTPFTAAGSVYTSTDNLVIGASTTAGLNPINGAISNARIVKGTAVYTSNFTPPTAPLTAISGTSLLTCQSNRFVDNSLTNATLTINGNTAISPISPFFPAAAWAAASNGGSMYFDGTGDYLSIADNSTLEFGSSDFTIESWIYPTATVGANRPIWSHGTNSTNWMSLYLHTTAGRPEFVIISSNSTLVDIWPTDVVSPNIWYHLAVTRSGSTFRMFLNGVLIGSATYAGAVPDYTDDYRVGYGRWNGDTGVYAGYIANLRILKGTALYTTSFVPPALPPTAVTNTQLLLNATNAGVYDATGRNVIETAGNAQVSTAVKKWGESSVFLDGSGDYLVIPTTNAPCQFGALDFTIEAWVYSTAIANQQMILSNRIAVTGAANFDLQIVSSRVRFGTTNTDILIGTITLSSNTWYHVAVSRVGTTSRLFINGVLDVSSTTSYTLSNNSITHIGTNGTYAPTQYPFIGYIQDLRVSKVGRYSGAFTPPAAAFAYNVQDVGFQQWTPANISVTAGVGNDSLTDTVSDSGTDTGVGGQVRGNYCTWNPLKNSATLADGNLSVSNSSTSQWLGTTGTFGMTSGKWYWEVTATVGSSLMAGLGKSNYATTGHPGADANSWGYLAANGQKYFNGSGSAYGASFTTNDVIGVAFDADVGTLTFYKNGVSQGTAFTGLTSGPYFPAAGVISSTTAYLNAGQRAFGYTAPSGFKCLVSTNLPTPSIGASASTQASDYFDAVIWTGADTGTSRSFSGLQFAPDLWWSKIRGPSAYVHQLFDSVRGAGSTKALASDLTAAEGAGNGATYGYLSSFDANGVTYTRGSAGSGTNPDGYAYYDELNSNYVAWVWNAGGSTVTNTSGTISAQVRANTTSGCSIVTFTGAGPATIGHGLGVAPSLVIMKARNEGTAPWAVYHQSIGAGNYLALNSTAASTAATTIWNNTAPTSTVFSIGSGWSTFNFVAYCFAPIAGFSAFGTYTGNGSADGPYVYTNFLPAYVLVKRTNTTGNWQLFDATRDPYNVVDLRLQPNLANAEASGTTSALLFADFVSNGFKIRGTDTDWNASGSTYAYIAFAEFPFKYSRAF